jgi:hypothetical protein
MTGIEGRGRIANEDDTRREGRTLREGEGGSATHRVPCSFRTIHTGMVTPAPFVAESTIVYGHTSQFWTTTIARAPRRCAARALSAKDVPPRSTSAIW